MFLHAKKLLCLICLLPIDLFADGSVLIAYGSPYNSDSDTTVLFENESGELLFGENRGVLSLGYFNDDVDISSILQNLQTTGIGPLLEVFNEVNSINQGFAEFPGYLPGQGIIDEQGVGKSPYKLLLTGIDSYQDAQWATGISLLTDSNLSTFPVGSDFIPSDYLITPYRYDTILLGVESSISSDVHGYKYSATQITINKNPPKTFEPCISLIDSWWSSDVLGVFYHSQTTGWIYHELAGWILPAAYDSNWFWIEELDQWAYTDVLVYPKFWLHSSSKWIYPIIDSGVDTVFLVWNNIDSVWERN